MDAALFLEHFPEFSDAPEGRVAYWSGLAEQQVNPAAWGDMAERGVELCTAHYLVLAGGAAQSAAVGGAPGGQQGGVNSKAVDKVSVGYDTASVSEADAGHWNETTYGRQYIRLARMFGAGGRQL